ncbi:MAG: endonuclease domain-containing protein [Sphingomonadales bacterium]|nr:endonuclease domain-containing protein [Sphingomonadales bacterium]
MPIRCKRGNPVRPTSPRARSLRRCMTDAERALWQALRNRQLDGRKFRRQATVGPYIADFACIAARLIVECDGGQHAMSATDARRTAWLEAQGWRVLRLWNDDILTNLEGVLAVIAAALAPSSSSG